MIPKMYMRLTDEQAAQARKFYSLHVSEGNPCAMMAVEPIAAAAGSPNNGMIAVYLFNEKQAKAIEKSVKRYEQP